MKTISTILAGFALLALVGAPATLAGGPPPEDFGDAPDVPYPTLLPTGARHVAIGPILGTLRDTEPDGQPNTPATGDDIAGTTPDDEDGVVFPTVLFPGFATNSVTVTTSGPGPYILNAWMDFNGNGSWADPGEQIFTDAPLVLGANVLTYAVPAGALPPRVYSRWRLDTSGGLSYSGPAADGEVEDYCHGSIHGQKWHDRNGDGKRDLTKEEGLNGYQIQLRNPDTDAVVAFVTTHDMDQGGPPTIDPITERGIYWMHGVPPGYWILSEKANPNSVQTFPAKCGSTRYFFLMNCEVLGRTPPEQPPICGNEIDWVDNCPPGFDDMFSAAQVLIQTPPGPPFNEVQVPLFANGPTTIQRFAPTPGPGASFQTEMLSMELTGHHSAIGPFHVRAGSDQGLPPTQGQVVEPLDPPSGDFHVDSFFDVFFEIQVPGAFGGQPLRPLDPVPIQAEGGITEVPPIGSEYRKLPGPPIPLLLPPYGPTDLSGFSIIEMVHKPIYGLDFANRITNAKKKADKRKKIRRLNKQIKAARKKGQRAKVRRLTRILNKCKRELRRL